MMENKNTLASETIADLTKQLVLIDGKLEHLYEEVERIRSMFRAVHYATIAGGISDSEADTAMNGIGSMLSVLLDNMQETMGISSNFIQEVIR
jgi:hypothetical protein